MTVFADPETERALLASVLEYSEAYYQAMALGLRAEHFSEDQNRILFRALVHLGEAGQPIAFETVLSQLEANVPGAERMRAALEDLTGPLYMPKKDIAWHVQRLQDKARRSRLVSVSKRAIAAAEDPNETTNNCLENAQQVLLEIQSDSVPGQATLVKEFLPQVLRALEQRSSQKGLIGLPTGLSELDDSTTGVRPGEFWVIGALPGRGKTALGAQIALATAASGTPAVIFSLEMRQDELGCRFLSNESTVSASRIRRPSFIGKEQWLELLRCAERIGALPLYVDDAPTMTLQALVARARLYIRRFGCRLVVVDYIRLINAPGRELREQVGNVTDALRQLAKSEKVGVVALSQLARPKTGNPNTRPSMLSLKESGDIEAHAHVVLLIHMPAKGGEPTGKDEIIIGKNRHGPVGPIDVSFSREALKFLSRSTQDESSEQQALDLTK
jgi:replicative DNA helicase